jgi:hypothetical protein
VLCKKNQCAVEICWPMWIKSLTPLSYHQWGRLAAYNICRVLTAYLVSHQRGSYPFSYQTGHWGFSLLEAIKKDGPGQSSGHSQAAQPRTCGPWKVYIIVVLYFSSSNTFLEGCLFALVQLSPLTAQSCFPALPLSVFGLHWAMALLDQPPA